MSVKSFNFLVDVLLSAILMNYFSEINLTTTATATATDTATTTTTVLMKNDVIY